MKDLESIILFEQRYFGFQKFIEIPDDFVEKLDSYLVPHNELPEYEPSDCVSSYSKEHIHLDEYFGEVVNQISTSEYKIIDSWAQKYDPGQFIMFHDHYDLEEKTKLCACLYLTPGKGTMFMHPFKDERSEYLVTPQYSQPAVIPGQVLYWEPKLKHGFFNTLSDTTRYIIACNLG